MHRATFPGAAVVILSALFLKVAAVEAHAEGEEFDPVSRFREGLMDALNLPQTLAGDEGFQALRSADFARFTNAVRSAEQAQHCPVDGLTYLHLAAALGQTDVLSYLLDLGVSVAGVQGDAKPEKRWGYSPLHLAVLADHPACVQLLLQRGADSNGPLRGLIAPVYAAAMMGSTNLLHILHEGGARVEDPSAELQLLHVAARYGHPDVVDWLLNQGVKVEKDRDEETALHVAAEADHAGIVARLLQAGADKDAVTPRGQTPLMRAAQNNAADAVESLLRHGATVNLLDNQGLSAIAYAIRNGSVSIAQRLADHGADLAVLDNKGNSLLHLAARFDSAAAVHWCLERGADLNARNDFGATPVYLAAVDARTNALNELLDHGADFTLPTTNGWTAIHAAATEDAEGTVRRLLRAGADIETRRPGGRTPLLDAVRSRRTNNVLALLEAGADVEARTDREDGALYLAMENDDPGMMQLLMSRGADPDGPLWEGNWSLLMAAAWDNRNAAAKALIEGGADPSLGSGTNRLEPGQTPLYIAVRREAQDVLKTLLEAGADPALRGDEQLTPWHLAMIRGQTNSAAWLAQHMTPGQMAPTSMVRVYFDYDAPIARTVSVVGTFNEWRENVTPMKRREDDGWWYAEVDLFPGRYFYKIYADGGWFTDLKALEHEADPHRNVDNSILYATNQLVHMRPSRAPSTANGYHAVEFIYYDRQAHGVCVAGEFNAWNGTALPMTPKRAGVWSASQWLTNGVYAYKFVVDGEWKMDPSNSLTRVAGGVTNSMLVVGPPPAGPGPNPAEP
ncbi:MAG: ankyrin repeat domain-containing protein [Kiritimatiellae bacterium]|nr:ankyrin repeat domain-containing protein [Kiritimatiellia bacterium]